MSVPMTKHNHVPTKRKIRWGNCLTKYLKATIVKNASYRNYKESRKRRKKCKISQQFKI
jgi:hypothetical protein